MAFLRYLMFHVQERVPEMGLMLSSCRPLLCCRAVAFVPAKRPTSMGEVFLLEERTAFPVQLRYEGTVVF